MAFDFSSTQDGSLFIGSKVFENTRFLEALKMFENRTTTFTSSTPTATLPNTNSTSIALDRGL